MADYRHPLGSSQSVSALDKPAAVSAVKPTHSRNGSTGSSRHSRQNSRDWEVISDPESSASVVGVNAVSNTVPGICEGFLMKRRKYPLRGWHKRFFVLDKGILKYSKTHQDIARGKIHGSLDVSLAVMSVNRKSKRIDLDAGDSLYHVKAKSDDIFYIWLTKLTAHRHFKKNEAINLHQGVLEALSTGNGSTLPAMASLAQRNRVMLEMQSRLTRVHSLSLSSDSSDESYCTVQQDQVTPSQDRKLYRTPSVADSTAEYFDASDVVCENLSENETSDESGLSDVTTSNSEPEEGHRAANMKYRASVSSTNDLPSNAQVTGRRTVLPAHSTDNSHIGILTILYNNIGKDLSRVSMPVALNEPLCLLQRVSEELEYSELLDIANHTDDPFERMVYVAAFSISGYAWASWRNRYKPFNPVLGETYENVREDRGFRYIAEQVKSIIQVLGADVMVVGQMYIGEYRTSTGKFSIDVVDDVWWCVMSWEKRGDYESGLFFRVQEFSIRVHEKENIWISYGDHYEWNKAVTCIHNVFSQQRWLEHYGDVVIRNLNNDECTCKITFVKSRYWGDDNSKNEVQGTVLDHAGRVLHRFGGSWHEGIFCDTLPNPQCIWKPNPQPDDYFDYYGFSQYARELNELTPNIKDKLPPTDSRFRPDQRLLEEGEVEEADKRKDEIEEKQRERRKAMTKRSEEHVPRFFVKTLDHAGREVWVTKGTYWKIRENPGFASTENLDLWC
ncbi:oxysterol-binding -related 7-like isoform X1 [Labeo rohita]|uniref:Oxysterol-binding-related 7-like isoform X1 n=1 Tax=Labeo rohita TaxID=84645 RepID=A0A498MI45_LABRO|nr:oxysterol-binding -related 7-like isoform X1 [Labeo rohita]